MRYRLLGLSALAGILALAACAQHDLPPGLQSAPAVSRSLALSHVQPRTAATLTFTLPVVRPANAPAFTPMQWNHRPAFLSPATASVAGTVGGNSFGPIAVSPTAHGCTSSSAGWECSITVQAPVGKSQLFFHTYATKDGTGSPLAASATTNVNIFPGQNTAGPIAMYGIPASLVVSPSPSSAVEYLWTVVDLMVTVKDAAGQTIPSVNLVSPLHQGQLFTYQMVMSGPTNATGYTGCCGISERYFYPGVGTATETAAVSAPGVTGSQTSITPRSGYAGVALLATQTNVQSTYSALTEFTGNSSGNAAPVRSMALSLMQCCPYYVFLSLSTNGNVWFGNTRYSNSGATLGSFTNSNSYVGAIDSAGHLWAQSNNFPACKYYEYPTGFGSPSPIREIDLSGSGTYGTACPSQNLNRQPAAMTVDSSGNFFVAICTYASKGYVLEFFQSAGNGYATPSRAVALSDCSATQLDNDSAGNLYVNTKSGLFEYAPGLKAPKLLLGGLVPAYFAVGGNGAVYVSTRLSSGHAAILEYARGATKPSRTIEGANTGLMAQELAVPRAGH